MPAPYATPPSARRTTSSAAATARTEEEEMPRPYVIVSHIGKGSFATVYKGYHETSHQEVAIKTIKRDGLSSKLLDNLRSEIDILKSLSHRHITKLLDIVRGEHRIYLIMEFCSGGDLTNYIKKRGRVEGLEYVPSPGAPLQYYVHPRTGGLDEIVVRSFLRQLARALKFLRQRNLVHRDIKPQNLLLNPASPEEHAKGHPLGVPMLKVADFGFARSLPNAMLAETLCGSPLYMAPEILRYEKYDAKADLWSVGAVLYEMAVGRPPFRAQNHIELTKKIEHTKAIKFPDEDAALRARTGGADDAPLAPVPADVKQLIRGLLKKTPAERLGFDEFFKSTALAKSKFPRPRDPSPPPGITVLAGSTEGPLPAAETTPEPSGTWQQQGIPEHHKVIPPEVLDPNAMIPPSKFNFRRREVGEGVPSSSSRVSGAPALTASPSASPRHLTAELPRSPLSVSPPSSPRRKPKALAAEGSLIPGETEEDGLLRKEYVLVGDTRAVEFTRTVDEIHAARKRPLQSRRTTSVSSPLEDGAPPDMTFPPPPLSSTPPPVLSSSPTSAASRAASNALSRALSLASKKLFGAPAPALHSPHHAHVFPARDPAPSALPLRAHSGSPRRPPLINGGAAAGGRDPVEDALLERLEGLAQKTDVLTNWADELYEYVRAVPQKPLADPTKFETRAGEPERAALKRRLADQEAESNAVTAVAVYLLVMGFAQKGIDMLRRHQEHASMRDPDGEYIVSAGFDDALAWYRERFFKCSSRVELVKTWLPVQSDSPAAWLYPLVYERGLMLSRTAARRELLDNATAPDECEKLYEESLWCLYTLQDDLLQADNPFAEEDRATIGTWIKRTKLRLLRCQERMKMNARDRVRDALADQNLDDVPRYPAPWEIKPSSPRSS